MTLPKALRIKIKDNPLPPVKIPFRRILTGKPVLNSKPITVTENVITRTISVYGVDGKLIREIIEEFSEETNINQGGK